MNLPKKTDYAFFLKLIPRWGDMDALGHVNNVKFFTYDESVRLEYFGRLLSDDSKFWKEYAFILAHIEADFVQQLKLPAELEIGFRVTRFGRTSMGTEASMFLGNQTIAVTRAVLVWFDYRSNTPLPLPDWVRAKVRAASAIAPEEK